LRCDKWLASSSLQKCIRRGHVDLALRAAATFSEIDPVGLWRRLISIACEDIGAADIQVLIETIALATSPAWRSKHDETQLLAFIVRRLAEASKDRSADLLMLTVRYHASLGEMRETCGRIELDRRLQLVANPSASLLDRAVAAWFSSGLDFRYEHIVGPGSLPGLAEAYRTLGVSRELAEAALMAARRTREPFTVLVPLVRLEIERSGAGTIRNKPIPDSPIVDGLPLCAIDEHTRPGKQAINRLVAEDAGLRACLHRFVRKSRWTTAAQHAAFYVDGAFVSPRLDWPLSIPLEALGVEADLASAEVPCEGVRPLLDTMQARLGRLNEIRREIWCNLRADPQYPSYHGPASLLIPLAWTQRFSNSCRHPSPQAHAERTGATSTTSSLGAAVCRPARKRSPNIWLIMPTYCRWRRWPGEPSPLGALTQ
jgi:hypothetical protein